MTDALLEAMARAHDRESAAQRGEPSPWSRGEPPEAWRAQRIASMRAALEALRQAGYVVVPAEPTERMLSAAQSAWLNDPARRSSTLYRAMLKAAKEDT